jgi:hypothetical protein
MSRPSRIEPVVGEWYLVNDRTFEVVALDADDGTIEIQHGDGSIEEVDLEDWSQWVASGDLSETDPPDDYVESYDAEDDATALPPSRFDGEGSLRAGGLDDLDLFDA